ncbi:DUF3106 domain-containing protein [Janthinobacterium sp.]|uniref:DUF3106 domain-containing protein n=1 Tax=Janthinobacterium sp. TaxID=1871054 RepID=UPI00293D2D6D|nr:DUF3106 domain-containing protein [Janthinobacterium sp.]
MAGNKVRNALIGLGAVAVAAISWVGANPPLTAKPAAAPVAPAAAPGAAKALSAGRAATPKGAPKALDKPLWAELTHSQQEALQPLGAAEWDQLDSLRKHKWLDIANRYSSMKPDEQQRVHERMRDWVKLTPEQRRVARENYTRSKKIEPGQKSAQWEQYQQLPEDEKRRLANAATLAAARKQLANLPNASQSQAKSIPPIKAGVVMPPASPTVTTPPAIVPAAPPAPGPAAAGALPFTATPANPAASSNVKQ